MDPFLFNATFSVLICQGCGYAVRKAHVASHLRRHHQNLLDLVRTITDQTQLCFISVPELLMDDVPHAVPQPIPGLHVYENGLRCEPYDRTCDYVCRELKAMKAHCRTQHKWSQFITRGQPSTIIREVFELDRPEPWRSVRCQRLFPSGPGSHFFEITEPLQNEPEPTASAIFTQIDLLRTEAEKATWATIQLPEQGEVSPWLERTGWTTYLLGLEREDLLALVEDPEPSPVRHTLETLLWATVEELIRTCERSATHETSIFVRFSAVQSSNSGPRQRHPLTPYVHDVTLQKSSRPWMQIVMLFVRMEEDPDVVGPVYTLSATQRDALKELISLARTEIQSPSDEVMAPGELSALQNACLTFCLSLLRQQVRTKEYESPFICALAVLGVTARGWQGPATYPSVLSALFKTSRYMFVRSAIDRTVVGGPSTLILLRTDVGKYMFRGTCTPFDWMFELRAYGMKVSFDTTREGLVDWDGERLLYGELHFTMTEFRAFIHGLHYEARRILHDELLFSRTILSGPLPSVPLASVRDQPHESLSGWSFLRDSRNQFPVNGDEWLYQQVQSHPQLRTMFFPDGATAQTWPPAIQNYFSSLQSFRTKLLLLVHLTAGQPARGTEILSVRFRNTAQGEHRNVFLEGGLINVTTRWHKGYTTTGDTKVINRFLPYEVSEDVVRYLWLVQPFVERLEVFYCQITQLSAFLWPSIPGQGKWTTDRVRRALQVESLIGLGQPLNIQQYRHIAIAISRKYLSTPHQFQDDEESIDRTMSNEDDHILDLQAGHSSSVAAITYARGLHERPGETYTLRQRYREASLMWHELLGFSSVRSRELTPSEGKRTLPFREEVRSSYEQRWKRFRTIEPLQQLRFLLGPQASFREKQEEAITAIVRGENPVLVVMPTAAGKSLLFLLPASYDSKSVTIVVVPLISLRANLVQRCASYGIVAREWDPRQPSDGAQVVFVTPESAITTAFSSFLHRLRTNHVLDRIVFDECHTLLNSRGSFRTAYAQLRGLLLHETQLIFLTATLPPSRETEFWRDLHLGDIPPSCFRTTTTRANISYRVTLVQPVEAIPLIQRLRENAPLGRTIIYCRTIAMVEATATALDGLVYHAQRRDKEENLQRFLSLEDRTIVATSALGLGVDFPDVSLVIHHGLPYTLIEYSQESGRAGRNGKPSQAVIVRTRESRDTVEKETDGPLQQYLDNRACRRIILDQYFDGREDRTKCVAPEALCDICLRWTMPPTPISANIVALPTASSREDRTELASQENRKRVIIANVRHGQKEEGRLMERGERLFGQLYQACFPCLNERGQLHRTKDCVYPTIEASYEEAYSFIRSKVRDSKFFAKYSGCYYCGLPQAVCVRWEPNAKGFGSVRGKECQYPEFLFHALSGILVQCIKKAERQEELLRRVQASIGNRTREGILQFLGRKVRTGTWETTEGVMEVIRYYSPIVESRT